MRRAFESSYRGAYAISNVKTEQRQVTVEIHDSQIGQLMYDLKDCSVLFFKEVKHSLEGYFHDVFKEDKR